MMLACYITCTLIGALDTLARGVGSSCSFAFSLVVGLHAVTALHLTAGRGPCSHTGARLLSYWRTSFALLYGVAFADFLSGEGDAEGFA